jgi:hypothetical protein
MRQAQKPRPPLPRRSCHAFGDATCRTNLPPRDIHRRDWSNLTARDQIQAGLDLLVDYDWLAENHLKTGGRPKVLYAVNPQVPR